MASTESYNRVTEEDRQGTKDYVVCRIQSIRRSRRHLRSSHREKKMEGDGDQRMRLVKVGRVPLKLKESE